MANKSLFKTLKGAFVPFTNAVNEAGGPAYKFSPRQALAQYAITGCLNTTFYASAETQLQTMLELSTKVEPKFVARSAVYCRQKGFMKDTPALLCAILAARQPDLLEAVFNRVIDDGRMLRNFVQIVRSGITGRKSLGSRPKKLVQQWLESRNEEALFKASVGQNPSLADVIKMTHPKPVSATREALYGYLVGRKCDEKSLPKLVQEFEAFKAKRTQTVPDVPFQMLTALDLGQAEWTAIARQAPWQMTRMNLNTFARHGVFNDQGMVRQVADRLRDPKAVRRSRVFPYQLMAAFKSANNAVPAEIQDALQEAMEIAIDNVPTINGRVCVCPDISGSMQSPVTGFRTGATSKIRCVDVAALVTAAILRKNPTALVLPFESKVVEVKLNPRDSVMTNADKLSNLPCGGTNCSAPLAKLNSKQAKMDLVIYISDNESWLDSPRYGCFGGGRTQTIQQWSSFKQRNPQARMVCIDIQPYGTSQAPEREDILNIGGFSDQVFGVITAFTEGKLGPDHWVGQIEQIAL